MESNIKKPSLNKILEKNHTFSHSNNFYFFNTETIECYRIDEPTFQLLKNENTEVTINNFIKNNSIELFNEIVNELDFIEQYKLLITAKYNNEEIKYLKIILQDNKGSNIEFEKISKVLSDFSPLPGKIDVYYLNSYDKINFDVIKSFNKNLNDYSFNNHIIILKNIELSIQNLEEDFIEKLLRLKIRPFFLIKKTEDVQNNKEKIIKLTQSYKNKIYFSLRAEDLTNIKLEEEILKILGVINIDLTNLSLDPSKTEVVVKQVEKIFQIFLSSFKNKTFGFRLLNIDNIISILKSHYYTEQFKISSLLITEDDDYIIPINNFKIGTLEKGINNEILNKFYKKLTYEVNNNCKKCWAFRLCNKTDISEHLIYTKDNIQINSETCKMHKKIFELVLHIYTSLYNNKNKPFRLNSSDNKLLKFENLNFELELINP